MMQLSLCSELWMFLMFWLIRSNRDIWIEQYTTKRYKVPINLLAKRRRIMKIMLAAYLKFLIDCGMNFSSIAILRIQRFLSALVCLVVTELIPSVSPFRLSLLSSCDPLCCPSLESLSSLAADFDSDSSSSSSSSPPAPPFVDEASPEPVPSSPFADFTFFYCFSSIFFSFLFFFPIILTIIDCKDNLLSNLMTVSRKSISFEESYSKSSAFK